jgi:ATPase subunit of ABC transporter with duplicated ATPase domains
VLQLSFSSVSFSYDSLTVSLIESLSFSVAAGWTGVVGPNGSGKTTILALAESRLAPTAGSISAPEHRIYCPQRTDFEPPELLDLLSYPDADAGRLASLLALDADWPYRWESLSHGERKRAQIAVALWREPELLLVDEPTNHLDVTARRLLLEGLSSFQGIGLIVSHDRELLDGLCSRCLFVDPLRSGDRRAVLRPGGVTAGLAEQEREDAAARKARDTQETRLRKLKREASRRRGEASGQDKKRSRSGLAPRDSDGRAKIGLARLTGKDGVAGRLSARQDARLSREQGRLDSMDRPIERKTGVRIDVERRQGDAILRLVAGTLALGDGRTVDHPDLCLRPGERRALVGPNGAGKSTLIRAMLRGSPGLGDDFLETMARAGASGAGHYLYLPQELSIFETDRLHEHVRRLPPQTKGAVLGGLQRLGSEPEGVLSSRRLSPGEARKAALALALEDAVSLIVMDEPTNHLDIVSIRCLEEALREYSGALLLVSHDTLFLRRLTDAAWERAGGRIVERVV